MSYRGLKSIWADHRGSTVVEFALVAPPLIIMTVGALYVCMALFLTGSLYYAVQEGARCASVFTTTCKDAASIQSYAKSHYFGPATSPTFTYTAAACGNSVSATVNFKADLGLTTVTIPITAQACYP